jgi:hypothetical protein
MEVILSSETSVPTRATRHHLPDDGIPHSHCHENLKSYIVNTIQFNISANSICTYTKQTPWPLVHRRTIPTERPPLVDEI